MTSLNPTDILTGKLVRLTAPRPDDKDALARWSHDSDFARNLDNDPMFPRTPDFFAEEEKEKQKNRNGRKFEFRIRTLADDKLIGFVELVVEWSNQLAWVGIGIGEPDYRSKGYGSDALRTAVSYGFRELGLYRVSLGVFAYNQRAIRAYEKVGFVHEGRLRSSLYRDGQRHDELIMGILRPEWEKQQAEATAALSSVQSASSNGHSG